MSKTRHHSRGDRDERSHCRGNDRRRCAAGAGLAVATDPARIKQYYLGADVETDWEIGSPITFKGEWQGKTYEDKGEILVFQPERTLAYSHYSPSGGKSDAPENYHVIEITLTELDGTTRVTLRQSNLEGDATDEDRASRNEYEKNWKQMLAGLKQTTER